MKLESKLTKTLTMTQEEFDQACKHVAENSRSVNNSHLGTYSEPSIHGFVRALSFYLFTGEGEK